MQLVLTGYGEIGKGMASVLGNNNSIFIIDEAKGFGLPATPVSADILLIAFPYYNDFEDAVKFYQGKFHPRATLIFSTVPIGTCRKLNACHFPIEAKHPHIARDIRIKEKHYLGGNNLLIEQLLDDAGLDYEILEPEHTEFLKLRSTLIYGINIAMGKYSNEVCQKINLDYTKIKEYDDSHNQLVAERGTPENTRYIIDAPDDKGIKGHCILENAVILMKQVPSVLIDAVLGLGKHPDTIEKGRPLYDNKTWLACEYFGKNKSPAQIAREQNTSPEVIVARLAPLFDKKGRL